MIDKYYIKFLKDFTKNRKTFRVLFSSRRPHLNILDDDKDDELFFVVWLNDKRRLPLFQTKTIVRDPHHRESPTRREQGLNLRRTWVQALLNEVVQ